MHGDDDFGEFGLLLRAAGRDLDRRMNKLLRPLGITTSQAEALQQIELHQPLSLGELGSLLIDAGGHPSGLVDRLVTSGLVQRKHASEDRRRIEISLTPQGRELAHAADARMTTFREWFRDQTKDQDLAPAITLLWTYLTNSPLSDTVHRRLELNWRSPRTMNSPWPRRPPSTEATP